jgi:hypothetical protein
MTERINTDLHINNKRLNRVLSGYRGKLAKGSNTVAKVATIKVAVGNGKLSLRLSDDARGRLTARRGEGPESSMKTVLD